MAHLKIKALLNARILLISFQQQSQLRSTVPNTQPMFLSQGHATPYNVINNTASKRVLLA